MTAGFILSYLLQASLFLAAGCAVYKLLLSRVKMPAFNRAVILTIYAVALIAPAIKQPDFTLANPTTSTSQPASDVVPFANDGETADKATTITPQNMAAELATAAEVADMETDIVEKGANLPQTSPYITLFGKIICATAFAGIVTALLKMAFAICSIARLRRNGRKVRCGRHVNIILLENAATPPFSLFNFIFISRADFNRTDSMIIDHELGHVRHFHSIDLLVGKMCVAIMWWNPAAWLLLGELQAVHEFQADAGVLDRGHEMKDYQLLLIKKAAGSGLPSVASSLNHSNLKKRFTMMYQKKPSRWTAMRAAAFVPTFCAIVALTGQSSFASILDSMEQMTLFSSSADETAMNETAVGNSADDDCKVNENGESQQIAAIQTDDDAAPSVQDDCIEETLHADEPESHPADNTEDSEEPADDYHFADIDDSVETVTVSSSTPAITTVSNNGRENTYVSIDGKMIPYAELTPEQQANVEDALKRADEALAKANESLRNAEKTVSSATSVESHEALKSAREGMKAQKRALQEQKRALQQQKKELRKQREYLMKEKRKMQSTKRSTTYYFDTDDDAAEIESGTGNSVTAQFVSINNFNNRTTVDVLLKSTVKPTVGSAYLYINGKRYNCKQPEITRVVKINDVYHTTVSISTKKLKNFHNGKDYVSMITNFGGLKIKF